MKPSVDQSPRETRNETPPRDRARRPFFVEADAPELDSQRLYEWEIGRVPMLSFGQEQALFDRLREGDALAKNLLILAYLRIVPRIAARYAEFGLPVLDLIQDGNVGLQKAVERFDHRRGNRLSSYAPIVIDGEIKRAIANTSRTIRIPVYARQRLAKIKRTEDRLLGMLFREPTVEEVAEFCDFEVAEVEWLRDISRLPAGEPMSGRDSGDSIEQVADGGTSPEDLCIDAEMAAGLREAVGSLAPREREIIEARWGLRGDGERTLSEVGSALGLTRERVRQIESAAMSKLRCILAGGVAA